MVQKIQLNEYLKRYYNMMAAERSEYMERAKRWLQDSWPRLNIHASEYEARFQNVVTMSMGWNDEECQMFEEGAKLLSALAHVEDMDTWLPDMLYVKSAKRAITNMAMVFAALTEKGKMINDNEKRGKEQGARGKNDETGEKRGEEQEKRDEEQGAGSKSEGKPMRPKHIDQYVHLLPEATQKRAAMVKDLLMQLDSAREKARLLMDAPDASGADRARWAKAATECDKKVRAIYKELDDEWEKLVEKGRVVCDAVGNVRVVEGAAMSAALNDKGKMINEKDEQGARSEEQVDGGDEQKNVRRELRKWLTDTRRGNEKTRETHVKKWREKFTEYLEIEGEKAFEDEKIKAAAAHYGVELVKQ